MNLLSKMEHGNFFKYVGYFLFIILSFKGVFALFKYGGSKGQIFFWFYILLGIIFIPVFYFFGYLASKFFKNEKFLEIRMGLLIGSVLSTISLVIVSFVILGRKASFGDLIGSTIILFVVGFILGIIIGFISRILNKVFAL